MRGRVALVAEISTVVDDAPAEEGGPLAVDGDAGGERVFGRDEPAGERQAVGGRVGGEGGQNGRNAGRHASFGLQELAPVMHSRYARIVRRDARQRQARSDTRAWLRRNWAMARAPAAIPARWTGSSCSKRFLLRGGALRSGRQQGGFDIGRQRLQGGRRVGRDGNAEAAQCGGKIALEHHAERERVCLERGGQPENGNRWLALPSVDAPSGQRVRRQSRLAPRLPPFCVASRNGTGLPFALAVSSLRKKSPAPPS